MKEREREREYRMKIGSKLESAGKREIERGSGREINSYSKNT